MSRLDRGALTQVAADHTSLRILRRVPPQIRQRASSRRARTDTCLFFARSRLERTSLCFARDDGRMHFHASRKRKRTPLSPAATCGKSSRRSSTRCRSRLRSRIRSRAASCTFLKLEYLEYLEFPVSDLVTIDQCLGTPLTRVRSSSRDRPRRETRLDHSLYQNSTSVPDSLPRRSSARTRGSRARAESSLVSVAVFERDLYSYLETALDSRDEETRPSNDARDRIRSAFFDFFETPV